MSDFVKALGAVQARPAGLESVPFDPFAPDVAETPPIVTAAEGAEAFPGAAKWDMVYRCQRFYIGRELQEVLEGGAKVFSDRDESELYEEVMRRVVAGEAMVIQRSQTILGDGSVVIWLEWSERKERPPLPPPTEREHLTFDELLSPERVTKRSASADADAKEPAQAPEDEDDGPSTNDEPDW